MAVSLRIGDVEIAPGDAATVQLPLARRYTTDDVHLTVRAVHGRKRGPRLFLTSTIHGDEINGVEIVRRVLESPRLKRLRGTLLAVPVVNVYGFLQQRRFLPDGRDLNRSFPGTERGSLTARLAHALCREVVEGSDAGVDLHTGSLHRANLPQVRGRLEDPATERLARAFGAPVVLDAPLRDGSLRAVCAARGIPLLVYEGGEALRFDELAIRAGVRGVVHVMEELGMLPARAVRHAPKTFIARGSTWLRAPASGVLRSKVVLGARVREGDLLATIASPLGDDPSDVTAPADGIVVGATQLPLVNEGDALYHVAQFGQLDAVSSHIGGMAEDLTDADFSAPPPREDEIDAD